MRAKPSDDFSCRDVWLNGARVARGHRSRCELGFHTSAIPRRLAVAKTTIGKQLRYLVRPARPLSRAPCSVARARDRTSRAWLRWRSHGARDTISLKFPPVPAVGALIRRGDLQRAFQARAAVCLR